MKRLIARSTFSLAALMMVVVPACASGASENALLGEIIQNQFETSRLLAFERRAFSESHDRARRDGKNLVLRLSDKKSLALFNTLENTDRGVQCQDENGRTVAWNDCYGYSLLASLPTRHQYLVLKYFQEGIDFVFVDDRTGKQRAVPGAPSGGDGLTLSDLKAP